jgi:hypothetical protein
MSDDKRRMPTDVELPQLEIVPVEHNIPGLDEEEVAIIRQIILNEMPGGMIVDTGIPADRHRWN